MDMTLKSATKFLMSLVICDKDKIEKIEVR